MTVTIIIIALVCFAGLIAVVATQPTNFVVTRSAAIYAPAPILFGLVNDFHHWESWSPWAKLDPHAKNTYAGAPSGEGAIFSWAGSKTGEGKMTLLESRPNNLIRIKLEFFKPFKANNTAEFIFAPGGDLTTVTWSMSGKNNFMAKAFGLFVNTDKMCGKMFEQGLANLQTAANEMTVKHQPAIPTGK
jgi:hypothetical protein